MEVCLFQRVECLSGFHRSLRRDSELAVNALALAITVTPQEAPQCTIMVVDNGTVDIMVVDPGDWTGQTGYSWKTGYLFAGWYLDEGYTQVADLSNVSEDMTIYAKYVRRSAITGYIRAGVRNKVLLR